MPGFVAGHTAVSRQRCSPLKPGRYSPPHTTAAQHITAGAREVLSSPLSNARVRLYNKVIQNCTKPELKALWHGPSHSSPLLAAQAHRSTKLEFQPLLGGSFLGAGMKYIILQSAERGRNSGSQPDLPETGNTRRGEGRKKVLYTACPQKLCFLQHNGRH